MEMLGIAVVGIIAVILIVKLLSAPIRFAFKMLINALVGFAVLFLLNFAGEFVGLSLGINWINAVVVGVLGAPGVVLLLLLKYFL
ncbi:MAG: pro-sigmaK processing inhibitor BofA family protein [Oscillospiraceae bacterium]|nr:pro-sigmaK processing inhibitor BofA family protein [Oscillospiraceae bacterium]MDY4105739.1 pro-sigmaK processing inhibitor BofA family protein [Oscillospiraceae bacterium]